jgi:hypothetical protein
VDQYPLSGLLAQQPIQYIPNLGALVRILTVPPINSFANLETLRFLKGLARTPIMSLTVQLMYRRAAFSRVVFGAEPR